MLDIIFELFLFLIIFFYIFLNSILNNYKFLDSIVNISNKILNLNPLILISNIIFTILSSTIFLYLTKISYGNNELKIYYLANIGFGLSIMTVSIIFLLIFSSMFRRLLDEKISIIKMFKEIKENKNFMFFVNIFLVSLISILYAMFSFSKQHGKQLNDSFTSYTILVVVMNIIYMVIDKENIKNIFYINEKNKSYLLTIMWTIIVTLVVVLFALLNLYYS